MTRQIANLAAGVLVLVAAACKGGTSPVAADASPPDAAPLDAPADAPADAVASSFSFVPASLDFGYVAPGTVSAPLHLVVNNDTSSDISGFALSLSGDDTNELRISQTTCTSTLGTSGCAMQLVFAPQGEGDHAMTMTAMAPGLVSASASIHAIGGLAPHPFGPTVASLDFGTVVVGSPRSQIVTYENSGTTTLPPISFAFAGESPDQYRLENDNCTGVQLPPAATCTVAVVYAPTAYTTPGDAILYGTASDTSELDLRGQASAATTLSISPTSHDFGSVGPGGSAIVPFTITNTGAVAATGFETTIYNQQFIVTSSTCTVPVAPGASCVIDVQLEPTATATGPDGGGMEVFGANASMTQASFTAIGIPAEGVILDTWSHDFGTAQVGTTGNSYTFTVTNVGTMATPVALSMDDEATQFSIAQDTCTAAPLAAGDTCTFEIVFAPVTAGSHFARIHATSASNDAIAHLTGTATPAEPPLNLSPLSYNYSTDAIGQILSEEFTIENPGELTKIPTVSLTGANASEFALMNDTCTGTSLLPSAQCTVDVWYEPATVGTKSASLQVTWSSGSVTGSLTAGAMEDANTFVTPYPPWFDFGAVTVGNTANVTFTFTNHGEATSPPVAFMLSGPNYNEFSLTADTCTGAILATGDSCTVTTVFAPASTGTRHGELIVTVGDATTTYMTGTGE